MTDIDDAKRLSPEERIKKLKELAKKKEEEIKKAQQLIRDSESELAEERRKKEIPIPEERRIDISELFEREELEQMVEETPRFEIPAEQVQYQEQLARELAEGPAANIYQLTRNIYEEFQENGVLSEEQLVKLRAAQEATQHKMDSIRSGDYLLSQESANEIVASLKIAKFLSDMYRA